MNQDPQRPDGLILDPLHLQHLYSAPYLHPLCRGPASVSQTSLPLCTESAEHLPHQWSGGPVVEGQVIGGALAHHRTM